MEDGEQPELQVVLGPGVHQGSHLHLSALWSEKGAHVGRREEDKKRRRREEGGRDAVLD